MHAAGNPEEGIYIDSRKHIARRKGSPGAGHTVMSNRFETQVVEVVLTGTRGLSCNRSLLRRERRACGSRKWHQDVPYSVVPVALELEGQLRRAGGLENTKFRSLIVSFPAGPRGTASPGTHVSHQKKWHGHLECMEDSGQPHGIVAQSLMRPVGGCKPGASSGAAF